MGTSGHFIRSGRSIDAHFIRSDKITCSSTSVVDHGDFWVSDRRLTRDGSRLGLLRLRLSDCVILQIFIGSASLEISKNNRAERSGSGRKLSCLVLLGSTASHLDETEIEGSASHRFKAFLGSTATPPAKVTFERFPGLMKMFLSATFISYSSWICFETSCCIVLPKSLHIFSTIIHRRFAA